MKKAVKTKKPNGRPAIYSDAIATTICMRLSNGESLRSICRDSDMPSRPTVHQWVIDDVSGFSARYTRAREVGLDTMADEILEISDDGSNDTFKVDGEERTNHDVIARSRLRVDSRKWYLSKMAPKRFGDKVEHVGKFSLENIVAAGDDE